jgi:nitroimidazol reductase NimA-like FMN-containing flavoprotein (pyridoxamine 5'-phosphate oxidase superfamily)
MFKEMRRQDRKINLDDAVKILEEGSFGILSTVGEDGYPYGVPLNYVYLENAIYFHSALDGSKLDNIKFNNKVSFCLVGHAEVLADRFSTAYESVIVFGRASEADGEEKKKTLIAIIEKYSKDYLQAGKNYIERDMSKTRVIKISVENINGKRRKA